MRFRHGHPASPAEPGKGPRPPRPPRPPRAPRPPRPHRHHHYDHSENHHKKRMDAGNVESRQSILKMLEDGKLSVEDALKLLNAVKD